MMNLFGMVWRRAKHLGLRQLAAALGHGSLLPAQGFFFQKCWAVNLSVTAGKPARPKAAAGCRSPRCFARLHKVPIALFLLLAVCAQAQFPQPQLTSLSRCGGRAGETVETKLSGTDLDGATLRFTHPGIKAEADAKDAKKQTVTIGKEVPAGSYDVRVAGKFGVSNPRVFQVGSLPEVVENDKHGTRDAAAALEVPCVVNGTAGSQQEDWYKLPVKKGGTLHLRCWAQELDSKMVPALALFDGKGNELRRERHRSSLEWQAKEDGEVFLQLNDYVYKGGADYFYRLEVSDAPIPAPSGDKALHWPLAKNAASETEPNDAVHPQTVTLPCEIDGSFYPARDVDVFKFHASKGEVWWIDVTSERLGLPTNPRAVVQLGDKVMLELNDSAPVPGMPDFDGSHLDPVGRLEVKEDGDYTLFLRDLDNIQPDHSRRYRLSIRKAAPDFALVAFAAPPTDNKPGKDFSGAVITVWNHNVRPGSVMPVKVVVLRRDDFADDIRLSAENPPPGLSSAETVIGKDVQETAVFIRAADDAKPFVGPVKIVGTAGALKHEARGTTPLWNMAVSDFIEPSRWRYTQEIIAAVVADGASPITLTTPAEPLEAHVGDKAKVHVKAGRKGDFKDAIKFKAAGLTGLEKSKEFEIAANATETDAEVDLAPLKLQPGTVTLWFAGTAKTKVKDKEAAVNVYSTPVILKVTEAPKKK